MFSGGFRGQKLKTGLRLSINRLKLMEKKKTEMAQKARREIADFIQVNKYDRARIRVEHIIREDYLVEAMELIEMYCDLLLARFGLIETMKHCDEALVEAVSSIIWATPRLSADCQELRTVSEQLTIKYGKEFGQQARSNMNNTVNERLINKLSPDPPPKLLVERYLIEIAKNFDVSFEPDPEVMMSEGIPTMDSKEFEAIGGPGFIGFQPPNDGNHYSGGNTGFSGGNSGGGGGGNIPVGGISYPPGSNSTQSSMYSSREVPPYPSEDKKKLMTNRPLPPYPGGPPGNALAPSAPNTGGTSIPDLPDIPSGTFSSNQSSGGGGQGGGGDDVDFDDLTRRFEELKKKK